MKSIIILLVAIIFVVLIGVNRCTLSCNQKTDVDQAYQQLEVQLKNGDIVEVNNQEIENLMFDNQVMIVQPSSKEKFTYSFPANNRFWPQFYYSFPYNYKYGGNFPPGMYSRLYFRSPGFYTGSGLTYNFRPGVGFNPAGWPRARWISNNGNYYYITNGGDYFHDAANYFNLPLQF